MQQDDFQLLKENLNEIKNDNNLMKKFLKNVFEKEKEIIFTVSILELFNESIYLYYALLNKKAIISSLKYADKNYESEIEKLKNIVDNIKYYNDIDYKIKENIKVQLEIAKDYFQDVIEVLYGYHIEAHYTNDVLIDKSWEYTVSSEANEEDFIEKVKDFINEVEDEKEERIQEIVSNVPFVMSKKRFYEYLMKGLNKEYSDYDSLIERMFDIEENFYGKLVDGYGDIFVEIFKVIEFLQALDLKSATSKEINNYLNMSLSLLKIIQNLHEISISSLRIINRLLVLYLSDLDITDILEKEPFIVEYLDFYYGLLENRFSNKEIEDKLKKCDKIISSLYFDLYRYNGLLNEIDYLNVDIGEVVDDDILKEIELLSEYESLINDDKDEIKKDKNGNNEEEGLDSTIIESEIRYVISIIDEISRDMKNDYRKVRMKRLMGIIPVPQDFDDQILNYIKNSIAFDTTEKKKASIIENVKKRMELYKDLKDEKKIYEILIKNAKDVI